jgi:cytochrome c oxidase subunit 1
VTGTISTRPAAGTGSPMPARDRRLRRALAAMLRTTDHKTIGKMYLVTALFFFLAAGLMALLMRAELARPGMQLLTTEQYNQLLTIHGTIMLLLYATPLVFAFANLVLPLQIGAPDVAFPRLNAFSYWAFLFGGLMVLGSFLVPEGAADFGWTGYTPLSDKLNTPTTGADLWTIGLIFSASAPSWPRSTWRPPSSPSGRRA